MIGAGRGGLILESNANCVEKDLSSRWRFYDAVDFQKDATITVTCFTNDGRGEKCTRNHHTDMHNLLSPRPSSGRTGAGDDEKEEVDHKHYHLHEHYHHSRQRSLDPPGPGYKIKSNPKYTEATFVFPNGNLTTIGASTLLSHLDPTTNLPEVINARIEALGSGREGTIARSSEGHEGTDTLDYVRKKKR